MVECYVYCGLVLHNYYIEIFSLLTCFGKRVYDEWMLSCMKYFSCVCGDDHVVLSFPLLMCWLTLIFLCYFDPPFWAWNESNLNMLYDLYVCVHLVTQSCPTLCNPVDCSLPGSSVHGDSPSRNIGVGCHALLQGIFPTQGSNPGLLHCRWIL